MTLHKSFKQPMISEEGMFSYGRADPSNDFKGMWSRVPNKRSFWWPSQRNASSARQLLMFPGRRFCPLRGIDVVAQTSMLHIKAVTARNTPVHTISPRSSPMRFVQETACCRARASDEKDVDEAYLAQQEVLKRRRNKSWEAVSRQPCAQPFLTGCDSDHLDRMQNCRIVD